MKLQTRRLWSFAATVLVSTVSIVEWAWAEDDFAHPPISYETSPSRDPIALWKERLKSGDEKLEPDSSGSYLRSVLKALNVPESSQCLVFSKTSLQIPHISPRTPRAIYFNDTVYIGSVVGSPIMEMIAIDPQLGCVFYTLERDQQDYRIIRDRGQCLSCHATTRTERVPRCHRQVNLLG